MKFEVGDELHYSVGDHDYQLVVLEVYKTHVFVRHSHPHETVQFEYYFGDTSPGLRSLVRQIEQGYITHVKMGEPDWEV